MADGGGSAADTVMDSRALAYFLSLNRRPIPELLGSCPPEEANESSASGDASLPVDLPPSVRNWREALRTGECQVDPKHFSDASDKEERDGKQWVIFDKEVMLLRSYMEFNRFTVLNLDDLAQHMATVLIPREVFKLATVECLSLRNNRLRRLSADIGRMQSLKQLVLSGNKLRSDAPSLPFTLTFCRRLEVLHIDYNTLDAVPGVVALLPSLASLHRHGNENYFRTTFMWYGRNRQERVHAAGPLHASWWLPTDEWLPRAAPLPLQPRTFVVGPERPGVPTIDVLPLENRLALPMHRETPIAAASAAELFSDGGDYSPPVVSRPSSPLLPPRPPRAANHPPALKFLAALAVAQTKLNFFELPSLPVTLQDYVASVYHAFNVCENCHSAATCDGRGFFTFTFRSVFLGNTYVPFQHWSCSLDCAKAIEQAMHAEEMRAPEMHYGFAPFDDDWHEPQSENTGRRSRRCDACGCGVDTAARRNSSGKWCCGRCAVM